MISAEEYHWADFWKSQGRKFCKFCKCWIADNKPSIEFHESGKKHKDHVGKRLNEIHKNSSRQMKQTKKLEFDLKQMENAAMAAYLEDLEENRIDLTAQTIIRDKQRRNDRGSTADNNPDRPVVSLEINSRHRKNRNLSSNVDFCNPTSFRGVLDEGARRVNSYDFRNRDKLPRKPQGKNEKRKRKENLADDNTKHVKKMWYESHSPEGWTYYWHIETKETSWERPAEGFMTITEQQQEMDEQALQAQFRKQLDQEKLKEQPDILEERRAYAKREGSKNVRLQLISNEDSEDQADGAADQINLGIGKEKDVIPYRRDYSLPDKVDPYGPWQMIKIKPRAGIDLQLPEKKDEVYEVGKQNEPKAAISIRTFEEKTLSQISFSDNEHEGIVATFKKRKLKNKNMRKGLNDD